MISFGGAFTLRVSGGRRTSVSTMITVTIFPTLSISVGISSVVSFPTGFQVAIAMPVTKSVSIQTSLTMTEGGRAISILGSFPI